MNKPAVKLCVDCKWHQGRSASASARRPALHMCSHPQNKRINVVTGAEELQQTCEELRSTSAMPDCSFEGKWFEPKEAQ